MVREERLALQERILESGTRCFLRDCAALLNDLKCAPKLVFDMGCAIGSEAKILNDLFPAAKIYATDTNQEYINIAKRRNSSPNITYVTSANLDSMIETFGEPDLIYWRMFLVHEDHPKKTLSTLISRVPHAFFAIEEPDARWYRSVPNNEDFELFTKLCFELDERRNDHYCIGAELEDICTDLSIKSYIELQSHPWLKQQHEKQLVRFLVDDLVPVFLSHGIGLSCDLKRMQTNIINNLVDKQEPYFEFYKQHQFLIRKIQPGAKSHDS